MNETVENQVEHDFLPLSPPIQDVKSPQELHYQSSSAPVGRPPPAPLYEELVAFFDDIESQDKQSTMEDISFQDFIVDELLPDMDPAYTDYALFSPIA